MVKKVSIYNNQFSLDGSQYIYNSKTKAFLRVPDAADINENLLNSFDCKNENDLDHLKVFLRYDKKWVFPC